MGEIHTTFSQITFAAKQNTCIILPGDKHTAKGIEKSEAAFSA